MKLYIVKWNKRNGKYQQGKAFHNRNYAIAFLNGMILDYGIFDAKLFTVRGK